MRADRVLPALVATLDKIAPQIADEVVRKIDLPKGELVVANILSDPAKRPNAKLMYASDITVGYRGHIQHLLSETDDLAECYQLGKSGTLPPRDKADKARTPSGTGAKAVIADCDGVKYAIVIRRDSRLTADKNYETRTYSGGSESGVVLIYDLATGTYHGGFDYVGVLPAEISAGANTDDYIKSSVRDWIEKHLVEAGATLVASNR